MSKAHLVTKILRCVEQIDTLNTLRAGFIIIIIKCIGNNILLILNFLQLPRIETSLFTILL